MAERPWINYPDLPNTPAPDGRRAPTWPVPALSTPAGFTHSVNHAEVAVARLRAFLHTAGIAADASVYSTEQGMAVMVIVPDELPDEDLLALPSTVAHLRVFVSPRL